MKSGTARGAHMDYTLLISVIEKGMSQHKKALGMVDMTLFTVSAILFLDTLAGSASMGTAAAARLY